MRYWFARTVDCMAHRSGIKNAPVDLLRDERRRCGLRNYRRANVGTSIGMDHLVGLWIGETHLPGDGSDVEDG